MTSIPESLGTWKYIIFPPGILPMSISGSIEERRGEEKRRQEREIVSFWRIQQGMRR